MEYIDLDKTNKKRVEGRYYLTYRVDNLLLQKYYIGICYSAKHPISRRYLTSSYNKEYWEDYRDHSEWFRFSILTYHSTIEDLRSDERARVTYKEVVSTECYNESIGGLIGRLDLTEHRINLDKERIKLGELTSTQKSQLSKSINKLNHSKLGKLYGQEVVAINRKLNNKHKKLKGELTSGDKSGLAKTLNLKSNESWLSSTIDIIKLGVILFTGECLDGLKYLYGDRRYLSERFRFKVYYDDSTKIGKRGVMANISIKVRTFND